MHRRCAAERCTALCGLHLDLTPRCASPRWVKQVQSLYPRTFHHQIIVVPIACLLFSVSAPPSSASCHSKTGPRQRAPRHPIIPTTYHETLQLLTRHHRYEIAGLKALARQKFAQELDLHLNDPDFPEACQEAYESTFHTDRGLRDVIVQAFRANPGLSLRPDVEMMVRETPGLAFELYRMAMGLPVSS
jgi:hypothetical protein